MRGAAELIIIEFKAIEKADKPTFDKYFRARRYENAHFNFTNLYMWRTPYNTRWAEADGVIYMVADWHGETFALQPFGPDDKMQSAIKNLIDWFDENGLEFSIGGVENFFVDELNRYPDAEFEIEKIENNFDYVYLADDLINLAGRKYHSKKNHLNAFYKDYPFAEYVKITCEIIPECRDVLESWYALRSPELPNDPFLDDEHNAIIEVLNNFGDFNLKGGAIKIDDRIAAFTFGEQLNEDTAVIHVEKANPEIRGVYAAINQAFAAEAWSKMKYINREEDMGLPNLRKAKESYRPVKLIEKFSARLKK